MQVSVILCACASANMDRSELEHECTAYLRVDGNVGGFCVDYAILVFKLLLTSEVWKVYFRHGLPFLRHGDFLGLTSRHSCDRDLHLATWQPVFQTLVVCHPLSWSRCRLIICPSGNLIVYKKGPVSDVTIPVIHCASLPKFLQNTPSLHY